MTATSPAKQFITAGKHRLCFVEGGDPGLPEAIFVHGWIASHRLYRRVFEELGQVFHYRAVDLPGFGDSDKPPSTEAAYDAPFFADALDAFAEALNLKGKKVTLVAQSMGASAALELSLRRPSWIERVIVIDGACVPQPPPVLGRLLQAPVIGRPIFMALGATRKALKDFLLNDVYFVKDVYQEATLDDMIRCISQPGGKDAAYASMMNMVSPRALERFAAKLDGVTVPVRLIWGDHDRLYPLNEAGRVMEKKIPGARLHVVAQCGHEPPVERPAAFLDALRAALA